MKMNTGGASNKLSNISIVFSEQTRALDQQIASESLLLATKFVRKLAIRAYYR